MAPLQDQTKLQRKSIVIISIHSIPGCPSEKQRWWLCMKYGRARCLMSRQGGKKEATSTATLALAATSARAISVSLNKIAAMSGVGPSS
jgi:hypothetical protein